MTRPEGYAACTTLFPGLKVSDLMDLVRVHGYGVPALTPLRDLTRPQGQALMVRIREKVAGKRTAEQVSHGLKSFTVALTSIIVFPHVQHYLT